MAEIRPLPGIRFAPGSDLAALVTPPYDVISPEAQDRYYARSPQNIIRLELGRDEPGDDDLNNRYTRAATTFAEWRLNGVFAQDAPALYIYEQRFVGGVERRRTSLLARVRLEPWETGVVLPHERTLSKPKADRLHLMRATAANLSPILSLYDDPDAELAALLAQVKAGSPAIAFDDETGEGHRLWVVTDPAFAASVAAFFHSRALYIADGHHRYETALTYRDEQAATRKGLEAGDPANFTLMALTAIEDPGLVVLPTHRLLRGLDPARIATLDEALRPAFEAEPLIGDTATLLDTLAQAGDANAGGVFALLRPQGARLLGITQAGRVAMDHLSGEGAGASEAWRRLDVAILSELIFAQALSVSPEAVRAGEHVSYTRDAGAALAAVRSGEAQMAFLLNATTPAELRDVARAGDRMPQKSTYVYPKLVTGLVINPLW